MRKQKSKFKQGIFSPLNPNKVVGNKNPRYLSSYELRFFRFCDKNANIVKWGSEAVILPYRCPIDKKIHRYMVDNFIVLKTKEGFKKYLVEIKPASQVVPPKTKNRKNKKSLIYEQVMYARNQSKWMVAKEWAARNGCEFIILTEKELLIKP